MRLFSLLCSNSTSLTLLRVFLKNFSLIVMPAVHFVNVHTVCQSVQYICFAHNKPSNIPGVAT